MRVSLFDCPVDILTMDETIKMVQTAIQERKPLHHVALNAAKLVNMRTDRELAEDVKRSDIVGIDGMAIVLALRFFGLRSVERVTGIDLMHRALELCAREGYKPYLLGAKEATIQQAANNMRTKLPGLEFAGIRNGYFSPADEARIVEDIRASGADCLFVGMPTPHKERFLAKYADQLQVPFIMGVGGSFDIWAGEVARAPGFMQKYGLEWLYRTYQEPRRMWWRYARTNTIFAGILLYSLLRRRIAGTAAVKT